MQLSFALSISHFVSSVGADAGFAALIGLAILVLLYFAHAREASTLREQLEAERLRIESLEHRLLAAGSPAASPTAAPVVAPASASPPGPTKAPLPSPASPEPAPATAAAPVAAPAGVGAPALIDATRVVPAFEEVAESADGSPVDGKQAQVPARALSAPGGTSDAAATGTAAPPRPPSPAPAQPAMGKTPSPMTAAAGGNGSSPPQRAVTEPALPPGSLLRDGIPGQRRSLRWLVPVALAAVAVVVAAGLILLLSGGSSSHRAARQQRATSQMAIALRTVTPGSVTVAVINGTTVNQLAHRTGQRLVAQGFKEGPLATGSNQAVHTTTVAYLPGHRLAALVVAHALRLTAAAVMPAQASTKAAACPPPTACTADVVVTVGTDLANAH